MTIAFVDADLIDPADLILEDFAAAARWHMRTQTEPHDEDFRVFRHFSGEHELFVDAGANIGNSVFSFRLYNKTARVVSFEPAFWLEPGLRAIRDRDPAFTYHMVGLGEREEFLPLYIPCLDRKPNFYLASMAEDRFTERRREGLLRLMKPRKGQQFGICETRVKVVPLDSLGLVPTILKIDVEEAEIQVLRGAQRTLARHHPLLLIEGANRRDDVVSLLLAQGYEFVVRDGDTLRPAREREDVGSNGFFTWSAGDREADPVGPWQAR